MKGYQGLSTWVSSLALVGVSCSGGGGGGGTGGFLLTDVSIREGAVWQINREIVFRFSEPIDFSTVSANTINIRSASDVPALGDFRLRDPSTVVFQPNCPTRDDFSDAGLHPGGVSYVVRVPGLDTSPNTVRSRLGAPLGLQQTRRFTTPASSQAQTVFLDARGGPPAPIVRGAGSTTSQATYLEIGGDPDERVYFELDDRGEAALSVPGFEAPLNLYSDRTSRVAVLIAFDQPISPSLNNVSERRLRLEIRGPSGTWKPIGTRVSLLANCGEAGARVRLEPVGVLPRSSAFRAVILPGFQDLVGEPVQQLQAAFAVVPTRSVEFTSLVPADVLADEFAESFDHGGESPLSFQDAVALFDTETADWGDGRLSAAHSFEGRGGPDGDFDWVVRTGELFFFDTTLTLITGGRDGAPNTSINAVNGVVDVRNFTIEVGAEVRVQGPHPMQIRATGEVAIRGRLDLSGFGAKDVSTLNTGNQVESGGAGAAGGGRGGHANEITSGPTPRGGLGQGPLGRANLGGEGGESSVSAGRSENARRPGGGGGGRFAKEWVETTTFAHLSMAAGAGSDGTPHATGVESGQRPPAGGAAGEGPFLDANHDNDFLGVRPLVTDGEVTALVRGELPSLWAGYGGGGGGNAGDRYSAPVWTLNSDEKGGGGGGGAGGLHVQALGRIVFGQEGVIVANGGRGATGENAIWFDHIGGTGGGGSGGHVILESAVGVDFTDGGGATDQALRDIVQAGGPVRNTGPTENVDDCRSARSWCCPVDCTGYSNGGAGGAGLVQIHVSDPLVPPGTGAAAKIRVPAAALGAASVLDQVTSPPPYVMIPTFGTRSKARSAWISIGGADLEPDGSATLVRFLFEGIDPVTGEIRTVGSTVESRAPLFSEPDLNASASARIVSGGFALELAGPALDAIRAGTTSGISNDVYLRTPALLVDCSVRLRVEENQAHFEDFPIASAVHDEGAAPVGDEVLRLTIAGGRRLTAFNPGNLDGTTGLQLLPRFFQVVTNGIVDSLPETALVRLRFQAAADNGIGRPDETDLLQDWTSDISLFNTKPAGALQFFRYEVEFDLDEGDAGISSDPDLVTLDFLKIPFVF
jgi:hypothetical protein